MDRRYLPDGAPENLTSRAPQSEERVDATELNQSEDAKDEILVLAVNFLMREEVSQSELS